MHGKGQTECTPYYTKKMDQGWYKNGIEYNMSKTARELSQP